jgi:hypothetical protein
MLTLYDMARATGIIHAGGFPSMRLANPHFTRQCGDERGAVIAASTNSR